MENGKKIPLSWGDVSLRALQVAKKINDDFPNEIELNVYPVPRGGIQAALAVVGEMHLLKQPIHLSIVENLSCSDIVIDDIIDSGATLKRFDSKPFYALVDKRVEEKEWYVFPWERMALEIGPEENVRRLIEYIGDDPNREGLRDTPKRVVKSYAELFSGYGQNPADVIKVFEDDTCDEMVVVKNVEFVSCCEHHMLPFRGSAHLGYIPNGKVIGVSKLVRLLEIFSRRLQIQERLCEQVTGALMEYLQPKGAACVLEASHLCMSCRGVKKQNSIMVTSSLRGVFKDGPTRHEFLHMIGK